MTLSNSFLLLYASQSGQAQAIAEEIKEKAPSFGLKARLFCLSLTDKRFSIEKESCIVFIVSTTGDGEPPDTAAKFFRRLNRQTLKQNFLQHLNYTILALGDSNYIKFCLFGRTLEKRLQNLSAKSFYPSGYGDDAYGIETAVDPWISNLWPALRKQLGLPAISDEIQTNSSAEMNSTDSVTPYFLSDLSSVIPLLNIDVAKCPKLPSPAFSVSYESSILSSEVQFIPDGKVLPSQGSSLSSVNVIAARRLTCGEDVKPTLELTLKFENECIPYEPGDSFGFVSPNPSSEINQLLERLGLQDIADNIIHFKLTTSIKKNLPSHIPSNKSLRFIFSNCVEIRSIPKKILLRILAEYTSNPDEKNCLLFLSSTNGSKYYTDCIRKPNISILDILLNFPTCSPPVEILLEYLPSLKPRFYSVSSSPLEDPTIFRIVFNVIKVKRGEGRMLDREGVCTGWLNKLSSQFHSEVDLSEQFSNLELTSTKTSVYVYKRTSNHFQFPSNLDTPVIMVGPGTGLAPFIGYLQHREKFQSEVKQNDVWLFYGCRWSSRDYLYKSELRRLKEAGILTHLIVSHSQETSCFVQSRYVHESIRQHASGLFEAINNGAKILVCGDAQHMAHDVQHAFIDIVIQCLGISEIEAKSFICKLQSDHRYVNDVWI
ncbi:methionine synthase reductase isoform X2 [Parasteatoda tepidariorum]|uniref:methionine synthase reductase isoform X2 n=1 Tax=Parasteatoda tepidariorum TaxID=114398 RepID=UPI001C71B2CC|nr:methionine synthase reductase isoform X3 [Parasteatoda tepidariorum]